MSYEALDELLSDNVLLGPYDGDASRHGGKGLLQAAGLVATLLGDRASSVAAPPLRTSSTLPSPRTQASPRESYYQELLYDADIAKSPNLKLTLFN